MGFRLGRGGRRLGGAVALLAVVGGVVACEPPPPVEVENPGVFTGTNEPGSFYEYLNADGVPMERSMFDSGNPACDNGIDDDADTQIDTAGGDPECDSADDANERLDGVQEYGGSYLPVTIEEDGRIIVDPSELRVEPMEKCLMSGGELWCLEIQPKGAGPVREGVVTPDLVVVPIPMTIDFDLISGYPGFDDRCAVGYTENIYFAEDYDEETGRLTLRTVPENPVPAIANCGQWTDLLNSVLGLPGTGRSELIVTMENADGETPRVRFGPS